MHEVRQSIFARGGGRAAKNALVRWDDEQMTTCVGSAAHCTGPQLCIISRL
jgi:hypothetical protein